MRVLCAPDKYKGTLTANQAAESMARGVMEAGGDSISCPVADGGEGTLAALAGNLELEMVEAEVMEPGGKRIRAGWGRDGERGRAVMELSAASGLMLLEPSEYDPTKTTTFGTGELVAAAHRAGCERVVLGVGGSATCDGGCGIAQALGARFFDRDGEEITAPMTGGDLMRIGKVVPPKHVPGLDVLCDVSNPLCGVDGAAVVYGPQKGATAGQVAELDAGLAHLAEIVEVDPDQPMFGAAGGAAFGLATLCGATLHRGVEYVLDAAGFDDLLVGASLVLTGEGALDAQSAQGKACAGVAARARAAGVPVVAIVGCAVRDTAEDRAAGGLFDEVVSLTDRYGEARAVRETAEVVREAAKDVAFRLG